MFTTCGRSGPARSGGCRKPGLVRRVAAGWIALTVFLGVVSVLADGNTPSGVLEFLDGASLHGRLLSVNTGRGVGWEHAEARESIEFRPANLASILFNDARTIVLESRPTCRFRFRNGDELYGNLSGIDADSVELETWFGGNLKAPRDSVQSLSFFWKGFSLLYEGPASAEGWVTSKGTRGWQYRDGGFVTTEPGILGRNFHLPDDTSLGFDVEWNSPFTLGLTLCTETMDRFDYSVSSYMFYVSPGQISLQRMQSGVGVTSMGRAELPGMAGRNRMRLEFRASRGDGVLAVLADGKLVQRWKDAGGFVAKGGGVVFSSQMEGPKIRVSDIRVAEWDGRFETDRGTNAPPDKDVAFLVNRDSVMGELLSVRDGKARFKTAQASLEIPMKRLNDLALGRTNAPVPVTGPWEVRAHVAGGGAVAFQLDQWGPEKVMGTSATFGRIALNPGSIRRLQFNLEKTRGGGDRAAGEQPGGFDE